MDLYNQLKGLSERIEQSKNQITTEESTKHAFILPFIQLLGYDVFNPLEVCPEFTADVGIKKGEKVDYAIFQNGEPIPSLSAIKSLKPLLQKSFSFFYKV